MHTCTLKLNSCSVAFSVGMRASAVQPPHQTAVLDSKRHACLQMPDQTCQCHGQPHGCVTVGRGAVMRLQSLRTDSREDNQAKPDAPTTGCSPHIHSHNTRIYTPTQQLSAAVVGQQQPSKKHPHLHGGGAPSGRLSDLPESPGQRNVTACQPTNDHTVIGVKSS
jgi:hypothetical protein